MNRRWLLTGLLITIVLSAAYLVWQGNNIKPPVEIIQVPEPAVKSAAIPAMDLLTYRKIETATFAMG